MTTEEKYLWNLITVMKAHYESRIQLLEAELKLQGIQGSLEKVDTQLKNEKQILEIKKQVFVPHEN